MATVQMFVASWLSGLIVCGRCPFAKAAVLELGRLAAVGGLVSSAVGDHPAYITRGSARGLHSGLSDDEESTVTVVTNGDEFIAASASAEHIELREHIILENKHAQPWAHLELPTSLKSIRGNCGDKPFPTSGDMGTGPLVPGLLPQKPGQCILMIGTSLSFFGSGANTDRSDFSGPVTLLESIYLRAINHLNTMHADSDRDIYMSNVTIQGGVSIEEGPPDGAGGIRLQGALYAEGTTFADLVPEDMHPYVVRAGDSVNLYGCEFKNNHVHSTAGALIVAALHGTARLERCRYTSNSVNQDFFDNNENDPSVFFSDEPRHVGFLLGDGVVTSPLEAAGDGFMVVGDTRVAAIRSAVQNARRVTPDGVPGSGGPQLELGLAQTDAEPPAASPPPPAAPPPREVDDKQPAPGNEAEDPADDSTDHAHAADHDHWWHRDKSRARSIASVPLGGCTLLLLALTLGLLSQQH